jgi:hypothetical protein
MTPEGIQSAIEFYHSVFVERLKSDPAGARRFIREVKFGTPNEVLESNTAVFDDPNDMYRKDVESILSRYPEIETHEELLAVLDYEVWKQNPSSRPHE